MTEFEVIDKIRNRPGMYFGKTSISRLRAFLDGCFYVLTEMGAYEKILSPERPLPFWFFHEFTAKKLGYSESTAGWANMIIAKYGDDKAAFDEFLKLYDEFAAMRITGCMSAKLKPENKQFCRELNIRVLRERNGVFCDGCLFDEPISIYIARLSAGYELLLCESENALQTEHHFLNSGEGAKEAERYFGQIENLKECEVSEIPFEKKFEIT